MRTLSLALLSALSALSILGTLELTALPAHSFQSDVLTQASRALNEISRKATPAVVSITSIKAPEAQSKGLEFSPDSADKMTLGIGSGVVLRPEGTILTNQHVVQNAERVTVTFDDKTKVSAHVIGSDSNTDLAVIQLDKRPKQALPTLSFGDSSQIAVGDWAIAIGSPFGLNRTVTTGIVSAIGRGQLGVLDIEDFIQTDAAINPGNSGGPLLNSNGQLIGINTAIFSQSGGFIGIGFAIPSNTAETIFKEILRHGRVIRGWMGITAQDLNNGLANYFKQPSSQGALISQVFPKGPADQASLRIGDVIIRYAGIHIISANHLKSLVAKTQSGAKIPLEVSRDGKTENLTVSVREQPTKNATRTQQAGQAGGHPHSYPYFGLGVEDIPPEFTELFGIPPHSGALISGIKPGSPAYDAGLGVGDIILSINKAKIHDAKEFFELIKPVKNPEPTVLYVQKGPDEKVFVPVQSNLS